MSIQSSMTSMYILFTYQTKWEIVGELEDYIYNSTAFHANLQLSLQPIGHTFGTNVNRSSHSLYPYKRNIESPVLSFTKSRL